MPFNGRQPFFEGDVVGGRRVALQSSQCCIQLAKEFCRTLRRDCHSQTDRVKVNLGLHDPERCGITGSVESAQDTGRKIARFYFLQYFIIAGKLNKGVADVLAVSHGFQGFGVPVILWHTYAQPPQFVQIGDVAVVRINGAPVLYQGIAGKMDRLHQRVLERNGEENVDFAPVKALESVLGSPGNIGNVPPLFLSDGIHDINGKPFFNAIFHECQRLFRDESHTQFNGAGLLPPKEQQHPHAQPD